MSKYLAMLKALEQRKVGLPEPDLPSEKLSHLWLPWGPRFSADDVRRMRTDLVGIIETLADMERWPAEHRDDVLARAVRGPLADLLPNLAHFRERLATAQAQAAARAATSRRAWRFDR